MYTGNIKINKNSTILKKLTVNLNKSVMDG